MICPSEYRYGGAGGREATGRSRAAGRVPTTGDGMVGAGRPEFLLRHSLFYGVFRSVRLLVRCRCEKRRIRTPFFCVRSFLRSERTAATGRRGRIVCGILSLSGAVRRKSDRNFRFGRRFRIFIRILSCRRHGTVCIDPAFPMRGERSGCCRMGSRCTKRAEGRRSLRPCTGAADLPRAARTVGIRPGAVRVG